MHWNDFGILFCCFVQIQNLVDFTDLQNGKTTILVNFLQTILKKCYNCNFEEYQENKIKK